MGARSLPVVAAVLVLGLLHVARDFFVPLAIALLFHFFFYPIVRALRLRLKIPFPLGSITVLLLFLVVLGTVATNLASPAEKWLRRLPEESVSVESKIRDLFRPVHELTRSAESVTEIVEGGPAAAGSVHIRSHALRDYLVERGGTILGGGVLFILFLYFLMAYREVVERNVLKLLPEPERAPAHRTFLDLEHEVARYFWTISFINLIGIAGVQSLAMAAVGMPNPVLWGALCGVAEFVPYIGAMVGTVVIGLVAFLTFDEFSRMILPPLVYYGVTAIGGGFIAPTIVGHRFTVNPLWIIVWLGFWGVLWGIPGAFVSVPYLVIIKLLAERTAKLRRYASLLGMSDPRAP